VSRFFRDGWDFGLLTVLVGLPVVAVLMFLIGVSIWDLLGHPVQHWQFWVMMALWWGSWGLRRHRNRSPDDEQSGGYVQASREIEERVGR
jgi:hypothetical protein